MSEGLENSLHYPLKEPEEHKKAFRKQFEIQAVEDVDDRLGIIALPKKSKL